MSKVSVACIVILNKKILIAHRMNVGQMGGRWEFPGGKQEAGETDEQTVIRECGEEFGIAVSVGEKVTESSFVHNGQKVLLHVIATGGLNSVLKPITDVFSEVDKELTLFGLKEIAEQVKR